MILKIKKIVEFCLDMYLLPKSKSFQDYISARLVRLGTYRLVPDKLNSTVNHVIGEYLFYDLRKDDVVLDIGANVGGFSLLVCKSVKHVYAVEPLYTDILKSNIEANGIQNIKIFNTALGDGNISCTFAGRTKQVDCIPLKDIIDLCGGKIDFLKCDCEGGEWHIKPSDLEGIRRIEAEIHSFNGEDYEEFIKMLVNLGYQMTTEYNGITMMIHAHIGSTY